MSNRQSARIPNGPPRRERQRARVDQHRPLFANNRGYRRFGGGALACIFAFVLTACGSSTSGGATGDDQANMFGQTSAAERAENQASGGTNSAPSQAGVEPRIGMIEIDGTRHDLTIKRCVTMAGIIGSGADVNEPDQFSVEFSFLSGETAVELRQKDPYIEWVSGPSVVEGVFSLPDDIDAADIVIINYDVADNGRNVAGEARFIERDGAGKIAGEPSLGTFSFSCPEQG